MTFDWVNYIKISQELLKDKEEAYLRSSISRAYYGAFCIARNKKGYNHTTYQVHSTVINAYLQDSKLEYRKIGKNLDELKRARIKSDYIEDATINKEFATRMVTLALSILKNLI